MYVPSPTGGRGFWFFCICSDRTVIFTEGKTISHVLETTHALCVWAPLSQNIVGGITQTASAAVCSLFQTQTLLHCVLLWDRSGEKSNAKKTSEREKTHWRDSGPFLYPRPLWTSVTLHKGCASEKSRKSLFNMFWHSCCELWQEHFTLHQKRSRSPLLSDFPLPWYHQRWKKEMKKS